MISLNGTEFTLLEALIWLIVAAICGSVGSALIGYSPGGLLASVAVGLVGAMLGAWIARQFDGPSILVFSYGGVTIDLLWTIVGSALLVAILSYVRNPRRGYRRR